MAQGYVPVHAPAVWQTDEKRGWVDFGPRASATIEKAFMYGQATCTCWDQGHFHELSLREMRNSRGRALRRLEPEERLAAPPSAATRPPPSATRQPITGRPGTAPAALSNGDRGQAQTPPQRYGSIGGLRASIKMDAGARPERGGPATERPESAVQGRRSLSAPRVTILQPKELAGQPPEEPPWARTPAPKAAWATLAPDAPDGPGAAKRAPGEPLPAAELLSRVLHPALLHMHEPTFDFSGRAPPGGPAPEARRHTDTCDTIATLAEDYAARMLDTRGVLLPLPLGTPPEEVMAALSLALYLVSATAQGRASSARSSLRRSSAMLHLVDSLAAEEERERGGARPASAPCVVRPRGTAAAAAKAAREAGRGKPLVFSPGGDGDQARARALAFLEAWYACRAAARVTADADPRTAQAPLFWAAKLASPELRKGGNTGAVRLERLAVSVSTLWHCTLSRELAASTGKVVNFRYARRHRPRSHPSSGEPNILAMTMPSLEAAVHCARGKNSVGLVLISSAYRTGGGFLAGRYRGPEEEACIRSNLYPLLRAAYAESEEDFGDSTGRRVLIPEDGVQLCRGVWVFRAGASTGYAPMATPVQLTVIRMWMPNLMPRFASSDADVLGPPLGAMADSAYEARVRLKLETVFATAASEGVSMLVLSDEGLADLENDPERYSTILSSVLQQAHSSYTIPKVVFTGSQRFIIHTRNLITRGGRYIEW